jgi:hypothetical protein
MSWPLSTNKGDEDDLFLSIARTAIDMGGAGGEDEGARFRTTPSCGSLRSRIRTAAARPVPGWRIQLQRGAASKVQPEIYGTPKQVRRTIQAGR